MTRPIREVTSSYNKQRVKKKKKNRVRLWEGRLSVSLACKLNGLRVLKYRVLEENIGRTLDDINQSKILYDPPPRVTEIKTKLKIEPD